MKNKNGFTLVELLTVIAILGLILIISVPKVIGIIEDTRKTSFKKSADLIVQTLKLEYSQKLYGTNFNKKLYEFDKTTESGYKNNSEKLKLKGDKPSIGSVLINQDGKIAMAIVSNDEKYCATKTYDESEVIVSKYSIGNCYIETDDIVLGLKEYTVTFNDDGRETKVKVLQGNTVSKIASKGKTNYIFKYWSKEKNGVSYNFNTKITGDITLYAVYEEAIRYTNSNIESAYKYDETIGSPDYCVTGEEATCKKISLIKGKTYNPGTIIKYKVNPSDTKYFHILHDDGDTLTLQQRENTVNNVVWNNDSNARCNSEYGPTIETQMCVGPLNALSQIEAITSNWTNVNNISYTTGNTMINGAISNVSCNRNTYECNENLYTISRNNVKARLTFIQEITQLGYTPKFITNYLTDSSAGYWSMNAIDNKYSDTAFLVFISGGISSLPPSYSNAGARAVVEINK